MPIESWILLWKIVLIVGVGLFAALAVVVTIGGFFDVRRLFRILHQQQADQAAQTESDVAAPTEEP